MVLSRTKIFVLCSIACFVFGITGCEKGIAKKQARKLIKQSIPPKERFMTLQNS